MTTAMLREIEEIPEAAARLRSAEARARTAEVAARLRDLAPPAVVTVARGSSDHAATCLKYAVELGLGLPVASVGPSVASIYGARLKVRGLAAIAISQSGASEDLLSLARGLREGGAHVVALTNTPGAPLETAADDVLDIAAGPERAVAATKSFVNSVLAGLALVADWSDDTALSAALDRVPETLAAQDHAVEAARIAEHFAGASQAVVLGRGPGLGIAQEMALKLMETCRMQATAYSGAEVLHGPSTLLTDGFPVLALRSGAAGGLDAAVTRLQAQGADVLVLPERDAGHIALDPLLSLPAFYRAAEAMARARGIDPDAPAFLRKETRTR